MIYFSFKCLSNALLLVSNLFLYNQALLFILLHVASIKQFVMIQEFCFLVLLQKSTYCYVHFTVVIRYSKMNNNITSHQGLYAHACSKCFIAHLRCICYTIWYWTRIRDYFLFVSFTCLCQGIIDHTELDRKCVYVG